jgi:hypothetical protein
MSIGRRGPIIFAIDSTFKGTFLRLARDLFRPDKGNRVGELIFVCGLLLFPDGRRLHLTGSRWHKSWRCSGLHDAKTAEIARLAACVARWGARRPAPASP